MLWQSTCHSLCHNINMCKLLVILVVIKKILLFKKRVSILSVWSLIDWRFLRSCMSCSGLCKFYFDVHIFFLKFVDIKTFCYYLGFLSTNSNAAGEEGGNFFNSSLPPWLSSQTHITTESSPLRIASSRTQTGNIWFPSASY